MRKSIYLLVVALVLTGCSLSMEEYLTPMEDRGKEEPYTVETEYGSLTYQFRDSVNYVTENVQDYIERVESDTILYFKGDTPKKWLPYAGCKLAASISHVLPYGLNSKVLSVQKMGDLYRVATTHVSIDDVYESLDYCFDVERDVPPIDINDPETYNDKCYEKLNDSTVVYWSDWDEEKVVSRADEDYEKESEDKGSIIDVAISTKSIYGMKSNASLARGVWKSFLSTLKTVCEEATKNNQKSALAKAFNWDISLGVKYTTHTLSHMERKSKLDYEEQYTDTWSEFEFGVEAGMGLDGASGAGLNDVELDREEIGKIAKGKFGTNDPVLSEFVKQQTEHPVYGKHTRTVLEERRINDLIPASHQKLSFPGIGPVRSPIIMAGPVPICLIFSATTGPIFEISGTVTGQIKYISNRTRSGYVVSKGDKKKFENEVVEEGSFKRPEVSLDGKVTVGINGRVAVGIEVAGAVGVDIGVNAAVKAEAEGKMTWDFYATEEKTWYKPDCKGSNLKFYCDVYGDVRLFVAPFGFNLWENSWTIANKRIFNFAFNYSPTIEYLRNKYDCRDNVFKCETTYSYSDLDGIKALFGSDYCAGLRVYEGEYDENAVDGYHEYLSDDVSDEAILQGLFQHFSNLKEYKFNFEIPIGDEVQRMVLVPIFYKIDSQGNPTYIVDDDNKSVVEIGKPRVEVNAAIQTYGGPCFNFAQFDDGGGWVDINSGEAGGVSIDINKLSTFKFVALADVIAGSRLSKWGLKVHIYDTNGKRLLRKKVPFNKRKTGRYTAVFELVSNCQPVNSKEECLFFTVTPYYVPAESDEYSGEQEFEGRTTPKMPIIYRTEYDTTPTKDDNDKELWGTIMPEVDL